VTITAGTGSADVTVWDPTLLSDGVLPLGTVIWSNPEDGSASFRNAPERTTLAAQTSDRMLPILPPRPNQKVAGKRAEIDPCLPLNTSAEGGARIFYSRE
jgi:hypothetical protein